MKRCMCGLLFLFLLILPVCCWGMVDKATLYGTVYGAHGDPLPGVTVVVENSALGVSRVTITGQDGAYTIPEIAPAAGYRVTAKLAGHSFDSRDGIEIHVGDERVILPPLRERLATEQPKGSEETSAASTETVSAASSGVITRKQLATLPLYNRNFLALGLLTPNTHDVEAGSALTGATFSIAGARPTSNNFLMDGADNVASSSNQAVPFQVNDAIQEFRVTAAAAGAEYGRNLGGVVNVITQRGSNQFHGSAFGYFANDALNATSPLSVYNGTTFHQAAAFAGSTTPATPDFDNAETGWYPNTYNDYVAGATALYSVGTGSGCTTLAAGYCNPYFKPASVLASNDSHVQPFDSKQFGVNAGGALARDRWFVFGSYEGTRIDNPNPIFERVPTAFDTGSNPAAAYFGSGTSGYGDYQFAQKVLSLYPKSNVVGVPGVMEFYRGQAPNHTNVDNYLFRSDLVSSQSSSVTLRYFAQVLDQLHDDTLPASAVYKGNGADRKAQNQNASISYASSLSPDLTNEVRFGFTQFRVDEVPQDSGTSIATALNLPTGSQLPTFLLSGIDPQLSGASPYRFGAMSAWSDSYWNSDLPGYGMQMSPTLDGLFPFARIGAPLTAPSQRHDNTYSANESLSWAKGRHAIKLGAELRHLQNLSENGAFARGLVFSGNIGEFTSDSESDNYSNALGWYAGFQNPSFDYAIRQPSPYRADITSNAFSWFVQDTWRIRPRLTLTAGVRYEFFSVPGESNNNLWNYDPSANGLVQAGSSKVVAPDGSPCGSTRPITFEPSEFAAQDGVLSWSCSTSGSGNIMASNSRNFAPRLGAAWDVHGNGKTVVHAGAGWYYDQLPLSDVAQLTYNRPTYSSLTNPELIYGQTFGWLDNGQATQFAYGNSTLNPSSAEFNAQNQAASSPMAISAIDFHHSATPSSLQANFSIQQQLSPKFLMELGYVGTFASDLPVVANTNMLNEWSFTDMLGPVFTMTNQGHSLYNSLLIRLESAEWRGLRFNALYGLSRSMDNDSSANFPVLPINAPNLELGPLWLGLGNPSFGELGGHGGSTSSAGMNSGLTTTGMSSALVTPYTIPQDPKNFLKNEYGSSDFDSRQNAVLDFDWAVPSLHRAWHVPGALDHWNFSGVLNARSGQPFTVFAGPIDGELTERVNVTGHIKTTGNPNAYIDASNLQLPAVANCQNWFFQVNSNGNPIAPCLGNSGRNAAVGPSFTSLDAAAQKTFPVGESRSFVVRVESFNLLNHANYYNPVTTLSTDGIGLNPDFGRILSAHNPRQLQFAARLNW